MNGVAEHRNHRRRVDAVAHANGDVPRHRADSDARCSTYTCGRLDDIAGQRAHVGGDADDRVPALARHVDRFAEGRATGEEEARQRVADDGDDGQSPLPGHSLPATSGMPNVLKKSAPTYRHAERLAFVGRAAAVNCAGNGTLMTMVLGDCRCGSRMRSRGWRAVVRACAREKSTRAAGSAYRGRGSGTEARSTRAASKPRSTAL